MLPRHYSRKNNGRHIHREMGMLLMVVLLGLAFWTGYLGIRGWIRQPGGWIRSVGVWSLSQEFAWIESAYPGQDKIRLGERLLGDMLGLDALTPEFMLSQELNIPWSAAEYAAIAVERDLTPDSEAETAADPYEARWPEYPQPPTLLFPDGEPVVLIYHTHNSERNSKIY
jgi:hypothetical protein